MSKRLCIEISTISKISESEYDITYLSSAAAVFAAADFFVLKVDKAPYLFNGRGETPWMKK
jgi:hypothetical protein